MYRLKSPWIRPWAFFIHCTTSAGGQDRSRFLGLKAPNSKAKGEPAAAAGEALGHANENPISKAQRAATEQHIQVAARWALG